MKKCLIIIISFIFFSQAVSGQVKRFEDLIGKWDIAGEDVGGSLEIIDSANIYLTYMDQRKKVITYSLDLTKSPVWFDFTVPDTSGILEVKSLVQVFGDNALKWQIFVDEDRSNYFTASRGELLYLKKTRTGVGASESETAVAGKKTRRGARQVKKNKPEAATVVKAQ
jgi:hypothetical protein